MQQKRLPIIAFILFFQSSSFCQTIYLIGDAGLHQGSPILPILKNNINTSQDSTDVLLFLGDNIYPSGLHDSSHALRSQDQLSLAHQFNAIDSFNGTSIFIPGNHDWNEGNKNGLEFVMRSEQYIKSNSSAIQLPENGKPGPIYFDVNDSLGIVIFDSQWLIQKREGVDNATYNTQFFDSLKMIVENEKGKTLLIASHHPLYTHGSHGGYFTLKDHLFPLTNSSKYLWIPLPVLGSIYPIARKLGISRQDITHPLQKEIKRKLEFIFDLHPSIIYASGHEHALELIEKENALYIVSGSGSKTTALNKKSALFKKSALGYCKLTQIKESMLIEFIYLDQNNSTHYFSYTHPAP